MADDDEIAMFGPEAGWIVVVTVCCCGGGVVGVLTTGIGFAETAGEVRCSVLFGNKFACSELEVIRASFDPSAVFVSFVLGNAQVAASNEFLPLSSILAWCDALQVASVQCGYSDLCDHAWGMFVGFDVDCDQDRLLVESVRHWLRVVEEGLRHAGLDRG